MDFEMRKRGQVAIFIILAIVIVVGIIGALLFMGGVDINPKVEVNPRSFVENCVEDLIEDSIDKMMINGGQILPSLAISYQGTEWNYLCHNADYYQGCYNLHPMLAAQIESEIVRDTGNDVQMCFDSMKQEFEDQGFSVSGGPTNYSIDLLPNTVRINLDKSMSISKGDSVQSFEDFGFDILSPLYELIGVARLVVNDESQFCNFEYNGYMLLYPEFDIRRVDYRDSKIYRVIDRKSNEEFQFAVRSCAFAPGI